MQGPTDAALCTRIYFAECLSSFGEISALLLAPQHFEVRGVLAPSVSASPVSIPVQLVSASLLRHLLVAPASVFRIAYYPRAE
jgi:hypothetical protein